MATFAVSKGKKVQRLVKFICSVLLMVCVLTQANKQENTTWQEAMPQEYVSHYISAEQPVTERTIAHLYNERIAMPIHATSEIPGYHPYHSKSKCIQTAEKLNRYSSYLIPDNGFEHHSSPIYYHVIDYYIYTLEHILI